MANLKSVVKMALASVAAIGFMSIANMASATDVKEAPVPTKEITEAIESRGETVFPIGKDNVNYEKYFTGKSYLAPLAGGQGVGVVNVTFAPRTINHWHIHKGSCQILVGMSGEGWYQIWGEEPQKMTAGDTVTIPEGVKHWHGAGKETWFQHLAIMEDGAGTEWLEPVDEAVYAKLK